MIAGDLERLIQLLARLPGLGPRSARRAVLHLMKKREALMLPLAEAMARAAESVQVCSTCGNLDTRDPCGICATRRAIPACSAWWRMSPTSGRWSAGAFKGRYHVLGGTLSAIDGRGPEQLNLGSWWRARRGPRGRPRAEVSRKSSWRCRPRSTARPRRTTFPSAWPAAVSGSRASPTACRSAASSTTSTTAR
jgi:hypothetical protein